MVVPNPPASASVFPFSEALAVAQRHTPALLVAASEPHLDCLSSAECMQCVTARTVPVRMREHLPTCERCTAFLLAFAARPAQVRDAFLG